MTLFLLPLLLSFVCISASVFAAAYSRWVGPRRGRFVTAILRNALGMPLLGLGYYLAAIQPAPRLLMPSVWLDLVGWFLIAVGVALLVWALTALRWRAAAPSIADALVRQGPYAHVRHPLYDGVFLELAGVVFVQPTWPIVLSGLLALAWLLINTRVEEQDLRERISGYADYMAQVPSFIPRLRRS